MEIPKWELMQLVKQVLVRHGVDLTLMDYTVSKTTLYLSGLLRKDPSGDFSVSQLEAMLDELAAMPPYLAIQTDFSNWEIENQYGSWNIKIRKVDLSSQGGDAV